MAANSTNGSRICIIILHIEAMLCFDIYFVSDGHEDGGALNH
jgi:hypothetical protein